MNTWTLVWIAALVAAVIVMWRGGQLARLSNYVRETREELKKCNWPTWAELKGSTVVVMISVFLLGAFTVLMDLTFHVVLGWVTALAT